MLSRFISRASHLRLLTLTISNPLCPKPIYSSSSSPNPNLAIFLTLSKSFCSNHSNNGDNNDKDQFQSNIWKISQEDDQDGDSVFGEDEGNLAGIAGGDDEHQTWPKVDYKGRSRDDHGDGEEKPWAKEEAKEGDVFADVDKEFGDKDGGDEWATSEKDKPWDLGAEEKDDNLFGIGEEKEEGGIGVAEDGIVVTERSEEEIRLEKEEQELKSILKGNV